MKRELFFLVLFIIGIIVWYEIGAVEAFQSNPILTIPKTMLQPQPVGDSDPMPFAPSSDALLSPPPGQTASVNSYPYEDPQMKKAALKNIKNTFETLQGFLQNEAPGLSSMGDPSVQLPLGTARSDFQRLKDEMDVLKRNPGIESSLTIGDLNGINANMGYLQKKWRLSANAEVPIEGFQSLSDILGAEGSPPLSLSDILGTGGSPSASLSDFFGGGGSPASPDGICSTDGAQCYIENMGADCATEGDTCISLGADDQADGTCSTDGAQCYVENMGADCATEGDICISYGGSNPGGSPPGGSPPGGSNPGGSPPGGSPPGGSNPGGSPPGGSYPGGSPPGGSYPGGSNPGSSGSIPQSSGSNSGSSNISLTQLYNLQVSISAFIVQLQASGTRSPITLKRIDTLSYILNQLTTITNNIKNGSMKESDIPITKLAYSAFLPYVDPRNAGVNQGSPLPTLLSSVDVNAALANLFPAYSNGDASGAELARQLLEKYAGSIFKDVSYDVNVNFGKRSNAEIEVEKQIAQAISNMATGGRRPIRFSDSGSTYGTVDKSVGSGGAFGSIIQNLMGKNGAVANVSSSVSNILSKPYTLDWKKRSTDICSQISKRGLSPGDYGCLNNPEDVDQNFSYRGYAKMICARLQTNYDPGIPELCGCPSPTWVGWRP